MLKPRDWTLDAHEMMRRFSQPGQLEFAKACMAHGYQIGVGDTTEVFKAEVDKVRAQKEKGLRPQ